MAKSDLGTAIVLGTQPEWLINVRGPLIKDLVDAGYRVVCVGSEANARVEGALEQLGAEYRFIDVKRNQIAVWGDIYYFYCIFKLCWAAKPDFVFAYTVKPVIFGILAASLAGVRQAFALVPGLGYVFTGDTLRHRALQKVVTPLYALSFSRCAKVFFQNQDDRDQFLSFISNDKAVIVHGSGVDLDRFEFSSPRTTPVTFLLIARLIGDKGIREYVEAATIIRNEFPGSRFLLVGPQDPGPSAISDAEIETWRKSGVVEYLGPQEDVRPMLRQCSVYVLPSYREGTPRTVLEAMACGRAVITTDAPGCRETVRHGETGFLVPVKDPVVLAEAMRRFLESPDLIPAMGAKARQFAEEKYDVRLVNRKMISEMQAGMQRPIA